MVLGIDVDSKNYTKMKKLNNADLISIIKEKDNTIEKLLEQFNIMLGEFQKINLGGFDEMLIDKEVLFEVLRRDNMLTDELEKEIDYIMRYHSNLKDYDVESEVNDIIEEYEDAIDETIYSQDDLVRDYLDTINDTKESSNEDITMENIDEIDEENLPF